MLFRALSVSLLHASLLAACMLMMSGWARADDDAPAFDRPGIAFATKTLPAGAFAWEQGLPDASTDRSSGIRTTTLLADTQFQFGITDSIELQAAVDSVGHVDVRGQSVHERTTTGGDARVGVKWALPSPDDAFSWAVLGARSLSVGRAPVGNLGQSFDLGAASSWDIDDDHSVSLYADHAWSGNDGDGWLLSSAYGFPLHDDFAGYVEGGYGTGGQHMRVAGGGVTWMATPRMQLDLSFLRGLDRLSPDWQAGFGIAILFARRTTQPL